LILSLFGRELHLSYLNSAANFQAAGQQLQTVWDTLRSGDRNLKDELARLLAQTLTPATRLADDSVIRKLAEQVTDILPEAPTEIIRETTTIVEKSTIAAFTEEVIKLDTGAKLVFEDDQGQTFLTFGGSPRLTLEKPGIFNIIGEWQLDGTKVEITAPDLNKVDNLAKDPRYLVLTSNITLDSERILAMGNGLALTDAGAGGNATIDLDVVTTATTSTTTANSGLEATNTGLRLLGGCANAQVLSWDTANGYWECGSGSGLLWTDGGSENGDGAQASY